MVKMTQLTLIWFICCIPVITGGASTAGLYYAIYRYRKEDGRVLQNFRTGAKLHWKKATLMWLLCLAVAVGLFCEWFMFDWSHFLKNTVLLVVMEVALAAFTSMALWFYPVLVNFRGSFGELIGNAFIFSVIGMPYTIATAAMYAALVWLLRHPVAFGVCSVFAEGMIAYAAVRMYEMVFRKYRKGGAETE